MARVNGPAKALERMASGMAVARLREAASRLAAGQRPDTVLDLLRAVPPGDTGTGLELLGLLAHECMLRTPVYYRPGKSLAVNERTSPFAPFVRRLRERGHPLGALPAYRLPAEERVRFPTYGARAVAYPAFEPPVVEAVRRTGSANAPPARDVTTPRAAALIPAAVAAWAGHSNGRHEARVFRFARDLAPTKLGPALLLSLRPACLFRADVGSVACWPIGHQEAFAALFGAAANGGAYPSGLNGAYGRLAAWQSVAGLLGPTDLEGPEAVTGLAEAMGRAKWVWFSARGAWFDGVAWDLGLAVLRPDRRTLALLAATDTD
jgi:hypothetical protein